MIIAVANRKGGVGKTTTAVNVACGLTELGYKTLLLDMDTQGHAGLGLGIAAVAGRPSLHDIFTRGPAVLPQAIIPSVVPLLDVAPANPFYEHSAQQGNPRLLADALKYDQLADRYQMIVIDTAPSLDVLLVNALCAATGVLIPFLPHPLSAEGIRQFSRLFLKVRMQFNPALQLLTLTPVQFNPAFKLHRQVVAELTQQFGAQRVLGSIRTDIKLAEAFAAKLPVLSYASASRAAADYRHLTQQLVQLHQQKSMVSQMASVTEPSLIHAI